MCLYRVISTDHIHVTYMPQNVLVCDKNIETVTDVPVGTAVRSAVSAVDAVIVDVVTMHSFNIRQKQQFILKSVKTDKLISPKVDATLVDITLDYIITANNSILFSYCL